jgi:putative autoinducer-2 (AI-2) aldolase
MKNRLSRIFNPQSGRTVMLAIDHGYFQGPTTGLERIDLNILPLVPYADTLMLTRGILRSIVPPSMSKSIVLRVSGGTSILKELSNEQIAVDIEESIRLNVCAMAVQVFIGGEFEKESIINMTKMVDIMRAISDWPPESALNWGLTISRRITSMKVLRPLQLPAPCPS